MIVKTNSVVIVSLHSPKEKVWGILDEIIAAGVTVRGIDVNGFEEWLHQAVTEEPMGLATIFYPMGRIERIALDESMGNIPSLLQNFEKRTNLKLFAYLDQFHPE
jgi:hypothetical protein